MFSQAMAVFLGAAAVLFGARSSTNEMPCGEIIFKILIVNGTASQYFSETLILGSTNPQYDKRLFIELQVQYLKIASSVHVACTNYFFVYVLTFRTIYVHNMY